MYLAAGRKHEPGKYRAGIYSGVDTELELVICWSDGIPLCVILELLLMIAVCIG